MNVLVVDDDREIVDSISIFLSGEGYKAIKAYDGIEALDALSENEVHLKLDLQDHSNFLLVDKYIRNLEHCRKVILQINHAALFPGK